ncbi:ABC transporter permease [Naasia aerilata]|uniref:Transport permease protein n=1 Tax=Naasia aerilata TaxID=1162966 RepID=A0ABM8G850_9MICO|nr:ABC transporter permease [Naasia aerilata]BDZ44355.1 hypothetical protein GCM10025866_02640 [Naasia aerilata]
MTALSAPRSLSRASWSTQVAQVARRWIVVSWRQPWGLFISLLQPIVWIVLFGQVFRSLGTLPGFGGDGYIGYLVPGVLMMTVLYSGAWAGTGYIDDMNSGVMDQLLSAPIGRSSIITGQLIQQLLLNLVQSGIVLVIGWLAGARFDGGVGGILLALAAATLLAATFCCLSVAVALLARSQVALIGISQVFVLPATFLSTTLMPAALLPDWVQSVATVNPLNWAVDIARTGLAGTEDWGAVGLHAVLLTALAALALLWAVRSIRSYQRSV